MTWLAIVAYTQLAVLSVTILAILAVMARYAYLCRRVAVLKREIADDSSRQGM
jgi:hypothetical protein